jgi:hypothetical protein
MGCIVTPGVLSGDSLYWLSEDISTGILKFDLVSQSPAVVELPPDLDTKYSTCTLTTFVSYAQTMVVLAMPF